MAEASKRFMPCSTLQQRLADSLTHTRWWRAHMQTVQTHLLCNKCLNERNGERRRREKKTIRIDSAQKIFYGRLLCRPNWEWRMRQKSSLRDAELVDRMWCFRMDWKLWYFMQIMNEWTSERLDVERRTKKRIECKKRDAENSGNGENVIYCDWLMRIAVAIKMSTSNRDRLGWSVILHTIMAWQSAFRLFMRQRKNAITKLTNWFQQCHEYRIALSLCRLDFLGDNQQQHQQKMGFFAIAKTFEWKLIKCYLQIPQNGSGDLSARNVEEKALGGVKYPFLGFSYCLALADSIPWEKLYDSLISGDYIKKVYILMKHSCRQFRKSFGIT